MRAIEEEAAVGLPVVLVAHSKGGYTTSCAVEQTHRLVAATVYIAAVILPPSMAPPDFLRQPVAADMMMLRLFVANPAKVGATRIDFRSDDPAYMALVKECFAADADEPTWARHLAGGMHCDESAIPDTVKSPITAERFGRVPRLYVRLDEDRTVPPAAQDWCVAAIDEAMGTTTVVHRLHGAHSPMLTQPQAIVDILLKTAASTTHSAA